MKNKLKAIIVFVIVIIVYLEFMLIIIDWLG